MTAGKAIIRLIATASTPEATRAPGGCVSGVFAGAA